MSPIRLDLHVEVDFTVKHIEERLRKTNVHEESVICLLLNVTCLSSCIKGILVYGEAVAEA
jgi:hypothetical protein